MKEKLEMHLLNSEEMQKIEGGASCSKSGDTILCIPKSKVVVCAKTETSCPSNFLSQCSVLKGVTIDCTRFLVKPF